MTPRKPSARAVQLGKRSQLGLMEFYRVLDCLPSRWRPYFVTLALTGVRTGELCELHLKDLDVGAQSLKVNDSKIPGRVRTIYVAKDLWPWVMAAVPVPVSYPYLRAHWDAAVNRAGLRGVTVRDVQRLRASLLAQAEAQTTNRVILSLLSSDESGGEAVGDRSDPEEASLLAELLPVLALTEDQGRRMVLREHG